MNVDLVTSKTRSRLGSQMNDSAATGYSSFAKAMMEKMGWEEGKGLGKNEDGITESIKVKKMEQNAGIGAAEASLAEITDEWWRGAFDDGMKKVKDKKSSKKNKKKVKDKDKPEKVKSSKLKKDKKGKEKKKKLKTRTSGTAPSLEDLFTATGGSRLGMRARPIRKGAMKAEVK